MKNISIFTLLLCLIHSNVFSYNQQDYQNLIFEENKRAEKNYDDYDLRSHPIIFRNADFSGANLDLLDFSYCTFIACDFSYCSLIRTDLSHCKLQGCNFYNASYGLTDFRDSDLRLANFRDERFPAFWREAIYLQNDLSVRFERADLSYAIFFHTLIDGIMFDDETKMVNTIFVQDDYEQLQDRIKVHTEAITTPEDYFHRIKRMDYMLLMPCRDAYYRKPTRILPRLDKYDLIAGYEDGYRPRVRRR